MSLLSASRITGTTKPLGVSAAKPMWKYFLNTRFSPVGSSDALNRGNFCNAAMQALMMNTSGVSFTPSCAALSLSAPRTASWSVMSASSYCVTCGRLIQLACSRAPEIFWIRDNGLTSTAPNREKSTCATLGSPEPAAAGAACGGAVKIRFTYAFTSSWVMRPLGPVPVMRLRSAPTSRANLRTDGLAYAFEKPASSIGGIALAAGAATGAARAAVDAVPVAAAGSLPGGGTGAGSAAAGAAAAGTVAGGGAPTPLFPPGA